MIVTFDLRYAADHFPGIGTHTWELLHALLSLPGDERYRVIWNPGEAHARFNPAPVRTHPRVEWIECDVPALHWTTARRTGELLRRTGGDVYLSTFSLMPERPGLPVVLTLHDVLPLAREGGFSWWRRARFAWSLRGTAKASSVLTVSEFSRREISRHTSIPAGRVRVVRNGVPTPGASPPLRPAGMQDRPFALTVGTNRPHKNLGVLAGAWRAFGDEPPLMLVHAGPADPGARVGSGPAERERHVASLGTVTQGELEWLYQRATLLLHPSRYEGFGFPVVEAASRGLPVICSDIPALRELGRDIGRFVPAADAAAWASAVQELAGDPAGRKRMGEAAQRRSGEFTYSRCARKTLEAVREAVC